MEVEGERRSTSREESPPRDVPPFAEKALQWFARAVGASVGQQAWAYAQRRCPSGQPKATEERARLLFCSADGHAFQTCELWKAWTDQVPVLRKNLCAKCHRGKPSARTCRQERGVYWATPSLVVASRNSPKGTLLGTTDCRSNDLRRLYRRSSIRILNLIAALLRSPSYGRKGQALSRFGVAARHYSDNSSQYALRRIEPWLISWWTPQ